jgi:cardiolipin synthase
MPSPLNPANLLTLARVLMTPLVAASILEGAYGWALAWLTLAGITDGLDGLLARRFGWITRLGALLDPVADKALLVTAYVTLGAAGLIPAWLVWLVVARDLLILILAGVALLAGERSRLEPSGWGKLSTFVQILTGVTVIAARAADSALIGRWAAWLLPLAAATTALSGLHYAWRGYRTLRTRARRV